MTPEFKEFGKIPRHLLLTEDGFLSDEGKERFAAVCVDCGLDPKDEEYGSLTLLAKMFFIQGIVASS